MQQIGSGFDKTYDHAAFTPGSLAFDDTGKGYIFAHSQNDMDVNRVVVLEGQTSGSAREVSNGVANPGRRIAIAMTPVDTHDYAWFQVFGAARMRTGGAATNNSRLYTNAAAGQLNIATTAGASAVNGIEITSNKVDSRNDCLLTFPVCVT